MQKLIPIIYSVSHDRGKMIYNFSDCNLSEPEEL